MKQKLKSVDGIKLLFDGAGFHEFVIQLESANAADVIEKMAAKDIVAGVDISAQYPELGQTILLCVTETKTAADLTHFVKELQTAL